MRGREAGREEAGRPLWQVAEQLAHVITQEGAHQEGATDPDCAAMASTFPSVRVCVCQRNNDSQAALSFTLSKR